MAIFWVKRMQNILVPDGTESHDEFDKLPRGKTLRCEVTQPRNLQHHKLFWALCARIGKGIGKDAEWVERAFKVETGHFDIYEYGGRENMVLRSIAFSRMDQLAFRSFWEQCIQIMYEKWKIDPGAVADLLVPEETQAHG